jgi:hypothetical protein
VEAVTEPTLRILAGAGSVAAVEIHADGPSWYVQVRIGQEYRVVASRREQRRTWRDLNTVVDWLREKIGVATFTVHAAHRSAQQGMAS